MNIIRGLICGIFNEINPVAITDEAPKMLLNVRFLDAIIFKEYKITVNIINIVVTKPIIPYLFIIAKIPKLELLLDSPIKLDISSIFFSKL